MQCGCWFPNRLEVHLATDSPYGPSASNRTTFCGKSPAQTDGRWHHPFQDCAHLFVRSEAIGLVFEQRKNHIRQPSKIGIAGIMNLLSMRVEPVAQVVSADDADDEASDLLLSVGPETHSVHP